jgi:hypothetical protein
MAKSKDKEIQDSVLDDLDDKMVETEGKEALEAIEEFTREDADGDDLGEISFRAIFGGDILKSRFILKHILWIMFVVALMIVYTANRYSSQQDVIRMDKLRGELQEMKYKVLTQSSDLVNMTRQSNIEEHLRTTEGNTLENPTSPPYYISVKKGKE